MQRTGSLACVSPVSVGVIGGGAWGTALVRCARDCGRRRRRHRCARRFPPPRRSRARPNSHRPS